MLTVLERRPYGVPCSRSRRSRFSFRDLHLETEDLVGQEAQPPSPFHDPSEEMTTTQPPKEDRPRAVFCFYIHCSNLGRLELQITKV